MIRSISFLKYIASKDNCTSSQFLENTQVGFRAYGLKIFKAILILTLYSTEVILKERSLNLASIIQEYVSWIWWVTNNSSAICALLNTVFFKSINMNLSLSSLVQFFQIYGLLCVSHREKFLIFIGSVPLDRSHIVLILDFTLLKNLATYNTARCKWEYKRHSMRCTFN